MMMGWGRVATLVTRAKVRPLYFPTFGGQTGGENHVHATSVCRPVRGDDADICKQYWRIESILRSKFDIDIEQ